MGATWCAPIRHPIDTKIGGRIDNVLAKHAVYSQPNQTVNACTIKKEQITRNQGKKTGRRQASWIVADQHPSGARSTRKLEVE